MSRRTDYNAQLPSEQSLQDEEAISATGEGDEDMEDAEEQPAEEGYSACTRSYPYRVVLNHTCLHQSTVLCHCRRVCLVKTRIPSRLLHTHVYTHMDQLVLLVARPRILF